MSKTATDLGWATEAGWIPLESLRPVPCERRTVFFALVSQSHETTLLAVDRVQTIERRSDAPASLDGPLTLTEARILAVSVLNSGFPTRGPLSKSRLRALWRLYAPVAVLSLLERLHAGFQPRSPLP